MTNLNSQGTARPNLYLGFASVSGYTFNWSTGDTTEDISGLSSGSYCVTVTDCNGCTATLCDSIGISATLGCTDPTAMNYNAFANQDDGSCTYDCASFAIYVDSSGNVTGYAGNANGYVDVSAGMTTIWSWTDNNSMSGDRYNMGPGSYTLIAMTPDSNCYDTLNITITEPTAVTLSAVVIDESGVGLMDGSVDLLSLIHI